MLTSTPSACTPNATVNGRVLPARALPDARRTGKRRAAGFSALAMAAAVLLSACSQSEQATIGGGDAPVPAQVKATGPAGGTATGGTAASTDVPAAVTALEAKIKASVESVVKTEPMPSDASLRNAFSRAAGKTVAVETSQDRTPTGLAVDAMTAATAVEGQCVFAQVRDSKVTMSVLPVLPDGKCFVGDKR